VDPHAIPTGAEAESLCSAASSKGVLLMDALWSLCNPLVRELLGRVRRGEIGTPEAFTATIGPIGVPRGHRVEVPRLGGSFMLECLVYPLSLLMTLAPELSKPERLSAASLLTDRGVDVHSTVTLASAAGVAPMSGGFALGATVPASQLCN
jgi:predicted dehydrogenase